MAASVENEKLKGLVLEKTYTLRADSPALGCRIRITAPAKDAKVAPPAPKTEIKAKG